MKKFLHFCIGISLVISAAALFMFSVQPAYGERESRVVSLQDSSLHIAYINIDTINLKYKAYVELAATATDTLEHTMVRYQQKAEELQNRYAKLQEQVNMGTISALTAQREEEAINAGLDALQHQEAELAKLEEQAMLANDSISLEVALYMNDYATSHNIDFVFMYGTGMPIIYANDRMEITNECITELNARYDQAHPKLDRFGNKKEK